MEPTDKPLLAAGASEYKGDMLSLLNMYYYHFRHQRLIHLDIL